MSLKSVSYTDVDGRKKMVLLPEGASEKDADRGIPVGPPSLAELNLPTEIEVRLNNELFVRGIILPVDALRKRGEIVNAIQAAFKVDANSVVAAYLGRDYRNAGQESPKDISDSSVHNRRPRKPR
jgi:hypothetical protein